MRFNSFNMIHKALRAMMYDAALTLQQTFFADDKEAEAALVKVEAVIDQFEKHAYHEDTFILPAVGVFEPQLVEEFEKEHVKDIEIGNRVITLINIFRSTEIAEEKINCGSALNKAFRDFLVFNIDHMAKEEIEINRVLWQNYTDEELVALNNKISASIPSGEKMITSAWMFRGINKVEAITWLKAVKQTAPMFVFQSLLQLAEAELPEKVREEVLDAVLERELIY